MQLKLLTIPFSHYCEKARWALDLTRLPYFEEGHLPIVHALYNRKYGAGSTVPALVTEKGVLCDSDDILQFAYRHGIHLYPKPLMNEIRSWEARFNQVLGPKTRLWAYSHLLQAPELILQMMEVCPRHERVLIKPFIGSVTQLIKKQYGIREGSSEYALREIQALWDQTDRLLSDGRAYLVGQSFSAADLTLAALGGIMLLPAEYAFPYPELEQLPPAMAETIEHFRQSPTGKHIQKVYRQHRPFNQRWLPA